MATRKCGIKRRVDGSGESLVDMGGLEGAGFWKRQLGRITHREYKCPLCREVFKGLSAMGAHLKDHCT